MYVEFYAGLTSFVLTALSLPYIIAYSTRKNFVSAPDRRRIHKKITPSLGGVAIFLGFTLSLIIWMNFYKDRRPFVVLSVLIIPFILGLLDDLTHVRPQVKLVGQSIAAVLIFFFLQVQIQSGYEILDSGLPFLISFLLTTAFIIIFTNSYNLIDGIDGLAGSVSLVAFIFFGIWFNGTDNFMFELVCFLLMGATAAFLIKNWEPSKIFMGDTGSLVLGTSLAIIAIEFMNMNSQLEAGHLLKFNASVGTVLALLIVPITDTVRIIIIRIAKRQSIFKPDKQHIHHGLVRLGLSHSKATVLLVVIQAFFVGLALLFAKAHPLLLFGVVIFLATTLCAILDRLLLKRAR